MKKNRSRLLPFQEHRKLAHMLTVGLVMTPRHEFTKVRADDTLITAKRLMKKGEYDQLPVEEDGVIVGLVHHRDACAAPPEKRVGECVDRTERPVNENKCLSSLFSVLSDIPCVLIESASKVVGLVHWSDLNKQATRTYFYLWLAAIEMGLAEILKSEYTDESWISLLDSRSQKRINGRYNKAEKDGVNLDRIQYANLCDLITVLTNDQTGTIWSRLGFLDKKEWEASTRKLPDLRIKVMHPIKDLVAKNSDFAAIKDLDNKLTALVDKICGSLSR